MLARGADPPEPPGITGSARPPSGGPPLAGQIAGGNASPGQYRPLAALPKAHLHLHFTGAMRHATLVDLAERHRIRLPEALTQAWPPRLSAADERGWFRFQRLYDIARSVLRTPEDVRRLLRETAEDERAEGSGWLEIQIDPSGYGHRFGGLTPTVELVLDAAHAAATETGVGIGLIIAANRTKHPLEARTLARLAVQYAGRGVVGFGLSNDERRGGPGEFAAAFRIAARSGLLLAPHGGELCGPASVQACLDDLRADRIGHGVAAAGDPSLIKRLAHGRITLEVCPASNVALGVATQLADVPAAYAAQRGGAGCPGRRRPAAVRVPADRPVRDRPPGARTARHGPGGTGPDVGARLGRTAGARPGPAGGHRHLAGRPHLTGAAAPVRVDRAGSRRPGPAPAPAPAPGPGPGRGAGAGRGRGGRGTR